MRNFSFPRSAWERKRTTLRVHGAGKRPRSGRVFRPHAERGNEGSDGRSAITLTEVLISMGILTLGLLGVAAMFPVGGFYLQKGEVADRSSAVAQAAFSDVVARGMLNPENWLQYEDQAAASLLPPNGWGTNNFARPFATALRNQIERFKTLPTLTSGTLANGPDEAPLNTNGQTEMNKYFGSVYVIDPLSASSTAGLVTSGTPDSGWRMFPFLNQIGWPNFKTFYLRNSSWQPWTSTASGSYRGVWPLVRVTLPMPDPASPGNYIPMTRDVAQQLFTSDDDLAIDLPRAENQSSSQRWQVVDNDASPTGFDMQPLARQAKGDYSWMVTVAPPTVMARNALAYPSGSSYNYDVSVVVFYKRALDVVVPGQGSPSTDTAQSEATVAAAIKSTGPSGGELLLTAGYYAQPPNNNPLERLRVGEWMMVCGPHPQSTTLRPQFFAQWYKIVAIDKEIADNDQATISGRPAEQRYVTVRGPKWPWQPSTYPYTYPPTATSPLALANNLCACITPGAVAVHTKTLRLEGNSLWNGGSVGPGTGNSNNVGF